MAEIAVILRHLRTLMATQAAEGQTDAHLLEQFVAQRDEMAFAALLGRHGAMVLGVCKRILHDEHRAEDAFQATFLVLVRKAGSIRKQQSISGWLHGVALRLARKAHAEALRAERRDTRNHLRTAADAHSEASWHEARDILDEELQRLPENYRLPLVLCYLEGLTRDEAAARLGWTANKLRGFLERGRDRLRCRLLRRGVTLSAAGVATLLADTLLAASVPPLLAVSTIQAAARFAAGTTLTACGISGSVVSLTQGGLKMMALKKITAILAVALCTAIIGTGVGTFAQRSEPAKAAQPGVPVLAVVQELPKNEEPQAKRVDRFGDPLPAGAITRLGTIRFNHGSRVSAFHFTPDAKTIVSFGGASICLWDAATGKERARYATNVQAGFGAPSMLLPDGKTFLILAQVEHTLHAWDLEQGKESRRLQLPTQSNVIYVYQIQAFSPDGRMCATHTDHVQVWDAATGKELFKLPQAGSAIRTIAFAGNKWLVSADRKQVIDVWDARTGAHVRKFEHGGPVEVIATSPDGRLLAAIEHSTHAIDKLLDKDVVHIWDLTTGTRKHALAAPPQSWFMDVQFSADSALVFGRSVSRNASRMTFWEAESGKQVRELSTGGASALSADGRYLVAGRAKFALWDLKTGRSLPDEDNRHASAAKIHLSSSGDRVLTLGYDSFGTWDVATGKPLSTVVVPPYHRMPPYRCCSPDGKYVVSFQAAKGNEVDLLLWEVVSGKLLHTLSPSVPSRYATYSTAFTHDSSLIVTCEYVGDYENFFRFWDVRSGKEVRQFKEAKSRWGRPIFSGDGRSLYLVGRPVVAYDAATGAEQFSWRVEPPPSSSRKFTKDAKGNIKEEDGASWRSLAIAPNGSVAAGVMSAYVMSDERVKDRLAICDARTGKVLRRWSDSGINGHGLEPVIFSDDSRLLATADRADVHVWEVATASKVNTFRGHRDEIRALSFSGGGRRLASAADDATVLIWDLPLALSDGHAAQPQQALASWWNDLAGADARRAYQAIFGLAQAPAIAVPFLRKRLQPAPLSEVQEIRQCIADLGSNEFPVRQRATARLKVLGPAAAAFLAQKLQENAPLETRRRVEQLLNGPESRASAGEPLRTLRALTALEQMNTLDAQRLLQELAGGAPGAWLTREAYAALRRIASRQKEK